VQNHVGLLDEAVRFGRTLKADSPDVPRTRVLNGSLATERLGDGNARRVRQRLEFRRRVGINDTATSDDEGLGRRAQNRGDRTDVFCLGLRATNLPVVRLEELDGVVVSVRLDVLRK
jgi:hypothetical protein